MAPSQVKKFGQVADPGPLGLGAFALTTFVLSAHNAGWAPDLIWIGLAFFYGGVAQFAAGMWEFKRNNTLAATAFTTYGSFWLSLALFVVFGELGWFPEDFNEERALGFFLAAFFIYNTALLLCSLMAAFALTMVFFFLEVTLLCLFIGKFRHQGPREHATWSIAGGYFGIITAIVAWYTSFAILFNVHAKRTIIPVGSPILNFDRDSQTVDAKLAEDSIEG